MSETQSYKTVTFSEAEWIDLICSLNSDVFNLQQKAAQEELPSQRAYWQRRSTSIAALRDRLEAL